MTCSSQMVPAILPIMEALFAMGATIQGCGRCAPPAPRRGAATWRRRLEAQRPQVVQRVCGVTLEDDLRPGCALWPRLRSCPPPPSGPSSLGSSDL
eukprot:CAMPEP_0180544812 /NCGR_PEP_ID=MMETSP1036_2-20121128/69709_1 /TAXON_ID=632150 /ORGANISM="Azadinium spinosum, Strain 3D9" /LENGTH=95 /DNA_ID=CAMNT_0022559819 /DNA_START=86 /DNA_END=370 /DNA_ORIENTATION=-